GSALSGGPTTPLACCSPAPIPSSGETSSYADAQVIWTTSRSRRPDGIERGDGEVLDPERVLGRWPRTEAHSDDPLARHHGQQLVVEAEGPEGVGGSARHHRSLGNRLVLTAASGEQGIRDGAVSVDPPQPAVRRVQLGGGGGRGR